VLKFVNNISKLLKILESIIYQQQCRDEGDGFHKISFQQIVIAQHLVLSGALVLSATSLLQTFLCGELSELNSFSNDI
jgi:hypothetical protein